MSSRFPDALFSAQGPELLRGGLVEVGIYNSVVNICPVCKPLLLESQLSILIWRTLQQVASWQVQIRFYLKQVWAIDCVFRQISVRLCQRDEGTWHNTGFTPTQYPVISVSSVINYQRSSIKERTVYRTQNSGGLASRGHAPTTMDSQSREM